MKKLLNISENMKKTQCKVKFKNSKKTIGPLRKEKLNGSKTESNLDTRYSKFA